MGVTGAATIDGGATIANGATVSTGNLAVTAGNLTVGGTTTLTGATTMAGGATITGRITSYNVCYTKLLRVSVYVLIGGISACGFATYAQPSKESADMVCFGNEEIVISKGESVTINGNLKTVGNISIVNNGRNNFV